MPIRTQRAAIACAAAHLLALPSLAAYAGESQGMQVVKDPSTGELRAPTHEEADALRQSAPRPAVATPVAVRRPDGSFKIALHESSMSYSIVTRDTDGRLVMSCVGGPDAAQHLLGRSSSVRRQEHAHEHD